MISSFLFSILLFSMPAEPTAEDEVLSEFRTIEKGKTEKVDFPKNGDSESYHDCLHRQGYCSL